MDFDTFYNEWIPEHCPIHPLTSCVCVHLYLDIEHRIRNVAWVDRCDRGRYVKPSYRFVIHDKEKEPIPEVQNVHPVNDRKPFVEVHYVATSGIELRD